MSGVVVHRGAGVTGASGSVDTANSTSTILSANGEFTGTWTDVLAVSLISVTMFTNVSTNSLKIEFSTNGIDVDNYYEYPAVSNEGLYVSHVPEARYYRVHYTNEHRAQAEFRLQAVLHKLAMVPSTAAREVTLSSIDSKLSGVESNIGKELFVKDIEMNHILCDILCELKRMNAQLSLVTDVTMFDDDLSSN